MKTTHPYRRPVRLLFADISALLNVPLLLVSFFLLVKYLPQKNSIDLEVPSKERGCGGEAGYCGCGEAPDITRFSYIHLIRNDSVQIGTISRDLEPVIVRVSMRELPAQIAAHLHRKPNLCANNMRPEERKVTRCWHPIFIVQAMPDASFGNMVATLNLLNKADIRHYLLDIHKDAGFFTDDYQYILRQAQQEDAL